MSETVAKRAGGPTRRRARCRRASLRRAKRQRPKRRRPRKRRGARRRLRRRPQSPNARPKNATRSSTRRSMSFPQAVMPLRGSMMSRGAPVWPKHDYLYFRDKESLFQELVRSMVSPIVGRIEAAGTADLPARFVAETIAALFANEIFGTRREALLRLIITEGPRFPRIAEFYFHEVIERVVPAMRGLMSRAVARGELKHDALARFPQLLVAPALMAVVWSGLFGRFAPLDIREFLRAHIDLLFGERSAT